MKHLEVMKILTSLSEAKKIAEQFGEHDDYDMIELLELKYEKMFRQLTSRNDYVQQSS
jgi:isopenicillin N synthase-like dioxygenase